MLGTNITGSFTKKKDYVLEGENPGSKYDKANEFGIKIISEKNMKNL